MCKCAEINNTQNLKKNDKSFQNRRGVPYYDTDMENLIDNDSEETVIRYIPRNATLHALSEFFSACSDVTRTKIICALAISEMCVTDLSRVLEINQTTVSHQLRLLKNLGIVKCERQGKIIFYSLVNDTVNDVMLKGVEFLGS